MNPCFVLCTAPCHIQSPGLPDGWVSIQHASGATVYFHRESRVCTWGMPYTIKKGVTVKVRLTVFVCVNVVKQLHTCILVRNCGTYVQYMYYIQWAMLVHLVHLTCASYHYVLCIVIVFITLYNCMYCTYACTVHVLSAFMYECMVKSSVWLD